jgi:hypothetical protein
VLVRRPDRREAGRLEALGHVRARLEPTRRTGPPALHVIGGEELQIAQQLLRIEQLAARRLRVADREPGQRYRKNGRQINASFHASQDILPRSCCFISASF